MPTLADVAKKANVSKMTVSRAINHPEKVTTELRLLVEEAMAEIGYKPNYIAKSLVTNRTRIVRFIVAENTDTTEPYFMNLLAGISKGLSQKYYSMQVVYDNNWDLGKVDGLIYTGAKNAVLDSIQKIDIPCIVFGENDRGFDFVDVDNYQGISKITRYLITKGATEIFYFGLDRDELFAVNREKGYKETMIASGLEPRILQMENTIEDAKTWISKIIKTTKCPFAVVCATDCLGLGAVMGIKDTGRIVGKEILVTGFDGVFLDQVSSPKLTTMKQPLVEMGMRLAQIMIEKIETPSPIKKPQIREYFDTILIIRKSTKY
ncbi:MAG: LacI family DNA-binding transcriptional regulator [Culicoidibacterales bacterium]